MTTITTHKYWKTMPQLVKLVGLLAVVLLLSTGAQAVQQGERSLIRKSTDISIVKKRIALVVGNSAYQYATPLENPANDATDISQSLRAAGFQVTTLVDSNRGALLDAINKFGEQLAISEGGVGLFYYAGHGIQLDGQNYLIPVDAQITKAHQARSQAVDAHAILAEMDYARSGFNIVILDACRNNPFKFSGRGASRSLRSGLAEMKNAPNNTLIAFATEPGNVASDGSGKNGVYTKHLLKQLSQPGLTITEIFQQVRKGVRVETSGDQLPWINASTEEKFYFYPPSASVGGTNADTGAEDRVWQTAWKMYRTSGREKFLRMYIKKYPNGFYSMFAREALTPEEKPATQLASAPEQPARPPAAIPAAIPIPGNSQQNQPQIAALMQRGWQAYAAKRWTTPVHDSAVKWAGQVLDQDRGNQDALALMRAVFDEYLMRHNFAKASILLPYATPSQRQQLSVLRSNQVARRSMVPRQAAKSAPQAVQQQAAPQQPQESTTAENMAGFGELLKGVGYILRATH